MYKNENKEDKIEKLFNQVESDNKQKDAQKDKLVSLASDKSELFHDQFDVPFAKVTKLNSFQIMPIESALFKKWLGHLYYESTQKVANSESINSAINTLSGKACFEGKLHELYNRVAWHKNAIFYDLSDEKGRVVKITSRGWRVVNTPPILFRKFSHQSPQVKPSKKGNIEELKKYIHLKDDDSWLLIKTWTVHALIPDSPHPIPLIHGDHGSGKSLGQKALRKLIDPSELEVLRFKADEEWMIQALNHHWFTPFDNVGHISDTVSDLLCSAVTGSGFTKRQLYTDDDDIICKFTRCISLNGINIPGQKPDFLDRSLLIEFRTIPSNERLDEKKLWEQFEKDRPKILGGLLDILSRAMSIKKNIAIKYKPRMADFAEWGEAIARAMGIKENMFLSAYFRNIKSQYAEALEGHLVGQALVEMMKNQTEWIGTSTQLLNEINKTAIGINMQKQQIKDWPKSANILSRQINEIKTNLTEIGIDANQDRESTKRTWTIEKKSPQEEDESEKK